MTMVENAYVNHVPVMTGGVGHAELRQFYATHFIPKMPPDMEMTPLSRTIGTDQLFDEMVVRFTHTVEMDWMLPGIAPTGKRVEVALVVIVHFRDGKLAHEHIYSRTAVYETSLLDRLRKVELPFLDRSAAAAVGRLITKRKFAAQVVGGAEDRGDHRVIETPVPDLTRRGPAFRIAGREDGGGGKRCAGPGCRF